MVSAASCSGPEAEGMLAVSGGQITLLPLFCFSFLGPSCVSLAVSSSEVFCVNPRAAVRGQIEAPDLSGTSSAGSVPPHSSSRKHLMSQCFPSTVLGLILIPSQGPVWGKPFQSHMHGVQSNPTFPGFHTFICSLNYSFNMYVLSIFSVWGIILGPATEWQQDMFPPSRNLQSSDFLACENGGTTVTSFMLQKPLSTELL